MPALKAKIVLSDEAMARVMRVMKNAPRRVNRHRLSVGIHESEASQKKVTYEGNSTDLRLVDVAAMMEFGVSSIGKKKERVSSSSRRRASGLGRFAKRLGKSLSAALSRVNTRKKLWEEITGLAGQKRALRKISREVRRSMSTRRAKIARPARASMATKKSASIPPRPWLRNWFDMNVDRLKKESTDAMRAEFNGDTNAVVLLARKWSREIREDIAGGRLGLAALSLYTRQKRSEAGLPMGPPLYATHQLVDAIHGLADAEVVG